MKIAFFDTHNYEKEAFIKYQDIFKFTFFETKLDINTVNLTKGYDIVCIFVNDDANAEVINKLVENGVKLIALRCAGYNNVDLEAAKGRIGVVNVPAYSPYAVAEHAMALLLTSVRKINKAYNRTKEFNFSLEGLVGFDLHGKTIGVVGTGKIGKVLINICKGFGMHVIAYDKYQDLESGIDYVDLDTLFKESDIISLHCPLTPETKHLINKESIDKMKTGVTLINTSRGALVDGNALIEGIKSKKIGAACLDVYEEEKQTFFKDLSNNIVEDDILARLISMPNVIVTSHQAFLTKEAIYNIAHTTINNIVDYNSGTCANELGGK